MFPCTDTLCIQMAVQAECTTFFASKYFWIYSTLVDNAKKWQSCQFFGQELAIEKVDI